MELSLLLGRPPSELKASLTYADVMLYRAYFLRHGPVSPVRMYDRPAALIAYLISKAHGGKPHGITDFMPFNTPPEASDLDVLARYLKD